MLPAGQQRGTCLGGENLLSLGVKGGLCAHAQEKGLRAALRRLDMACLHRIGVAQGLSLQQLKGHTRTSCSVGGLAQVGSILLCQRLKCVLRSFDLKKTGLGYCSGESKHL